MIILPYYCAIGGWVIKYMVVFMTGKAAEAATDDYFTGFITSTTSPIVYMLIFLIATSAVILLGVNKGIEKLSKYLMPALLILVIIISIFSLTLSHTDENGVTRTGLQGLKVLVVPNLEGLTFETLFNTIIDAIGQLFFSLSVAMGIMVAYGSYVDDKENISKSINQIEIFDTAIAILAGVMIIPAVYVFSGREGMEASGPSLLFVSLPKIFAQMGKIGTVVGCLFFIMVLFAALTSSISILEAVVSSFIDEFKMSRKTAVIVETIIAGVIAVFVCLGYNKFYFEIKLPNGSTAQLLDILDYVSNYLLMPLTAILTCILVGWVLKPKTILDEVTKNGEVLRRKGLYTVMIKFVAPIMLFILLLETSGLLNLFK
jgi:neurotransmitter:Na+ symporter, NSS family